LEPQAGTFFQWGHDGHYRAYAIGSISERSAVVVFTNAAFGLGLMPELIRQFVPGDRPSLAWLEYKGLDWPPFRLLRTARVDGIAAVWAEIESSRFDREALRWIAHGLRVENREDDYLRLLAWIEEHAAADAVRKS
jgi:hypothetical protein